MGGVCKTSVITLFRLGLVYDICIPETKICWLAGARIDFQVHSETTRNRVETSSRIPWFFDPCQCYDNAVYKSGVDLFMLLGTWHSRCLAVAPPFIAIPLVIALWVSTCCCTRPFAPKPMTSKFNALLQTISSSDSEAKPFIFVLRWSTHYDTYIGLRGDSMFNLLY